MSTELTAKEKDAIGDIVEGTIGSLDLSIDEALPVYNKWLTILRKMDRNQDADEWEQALHEDYGLVFKK